MKKTPNFNSMKISPAYAILRMILSLTVGAGGAYALTKRSDTSVSNNAMDHASMAMNSASADKMADGLEGKTGDDFDKAFIEMMIEHHEGAVEMANQARQNAKHSEIKAMAEDIISVQTREIAQMKSWQQQWGH